MQTKLTLLLSSLFLLAPWRLNAQSGLKARADDSGAVDEIGQSARAKSEASGEDNRSRGTHAFLDLQGKLTNGTNAALATLDAVGTCRTLAAGGHEQWLPTQHCASASLMIAMGAVFDISVSYIFHRTGHHRLERIMEIAGSADSAAGVTHTLTHGGRW